MKTITLIFALLSIPLLAADATPRERQLQQLKAQFPSHVAGPVTDKSEAHVQACYRKYRDSVMGLRLEDLAERVTELRREIDYDISFADLEIERSKLESEKHGIRQNVSWLREKLTPYVNRLAQFQRGR